MVVVVRGEEEGVMVDHLVVLEEEEEEMAVVVVIVLFSIGRIIWCNLVGGTPVVVEEATAAAAGGADADVNPTFSADDGTDQDSSERRITWSIVNHSCMMLYYVLKCLGRILIRRHGTLSIPVWV